MMKRNKLYTLNRYNGPALVDRINHNIFDGWGSSVIIGGNNPNSYYDSYYGKAKPTTTANTNITSKVQQPTVMQQIAQNKSNGNTNVGVTAGGTSFTQTPVYIQQTSQGVTDNNPNGVLKIDTSGIPKNMDTKLGDKVGWQQNGYLAAAMNIAGQVKVNDKDRRGLFDTLDPFHNIAGKKADSTAVGKTLGDIGAAAASTGIPYAMLAGAALKVIGDIADNGWGYSIENEEAVRNNIAGLRNTNFTAIDTDSLVDQFNRAGIRKVGLGEVDNGLFTNKGTKKAEELSRQQDEAYEYALNSFKNAGYNIDKDFYEDYMRDYHAFGGPLNTFAMGGNKKKYRTTTKDKSGTTTEVYVPGGYIAETITNEGDTIYKKPSNSWWNPFERVSARRAPNGPATPDYRRLQQEYKDAYKGSTESSNVGVDRVKDFINNLLGTSYDHGGPLGFSDNVSAVNYGFMTDYLTEKKRQNDLKNKMTGMTQMPSFMPSYALGGDLQANGSDWTTGLTHVEAGGTHEENPYEGVQMGVDREGVPNLVEENETVYNDYVYSNRIKCDPTTKEKFHVSKKRDITFADLSKKLEKEIAERPNDPISQAAFKAQMADLAEQQERQKQEMEAARAREAFEALSPEEQTALIQQYAQQEQMAQEQAMQEQTMAEQAAAEQQPTPEEIATAQQQQMMQGVPTADAMGTVATAQPVMACGGKINRFDKGGVLKFLNSLGYRTVAEAEKAGWKPSDFGSYKDWKDINSNSKISDDFKWTDEFSGRLTSPEQKAMLSLGWNPTAALVGRKWYEGDNGNNVGWTASVGKDALNAAEFSDYANRYKNTLGWAVENGLIKAPEKDGTISMADIAKAMSQAPDWKKTDDWLYSDIANQAAYLGMAKGLNDPNDVKFDNKWAPYGTFTQGTDGNWNYTLKNDLTDAQKQAFTDLFRKARTDNKVGVMYNNFHDPDTVTNRYVLDENGNPVLLTGDDFSGYEQLGTYSWGDEANGVNNNAVLYRAKNSAGNNTAKATGNKTTTTGDDREVVPVHSKLENLRYAGLFGPAVGLGMQALGIGRPDTSGLEAAANIGKSPAHLASPHLIGDYMRYTPFDRLFYSNQLQANARATDRALANNSGANRGTAMAGLLANGYNTNNNLGNLYRQGEEYNRAQYEKTKDFNRGTNQFNADVLNRTSQFNADALNRGKQYNAQLAMQAAQAKMDADAGWYNGIYGNVAGLFKGLGDLGREKAQENRIADMAATGIFGTMKPGSYIANGMLRYETDEERARRLANQKVKTAKGGKIKRKKGFTY